MPRKKSTSPKKSKPAFELRLRSFRAHETNSNQQQEHTEKSTGSKKTHWRTQIKADAKKFQAYKKYENLAARVRRADKAEELDLPGNEAKKREYLTNKAAKMREFRAKKKLQKEEEERKQAGKRTRPTKRTRTELEKEAKRKKVQAAKKREQRARRSQEKKEQDLTNRRQKTLAEKEEGISIEKEKTEILQERAREAAEKKRLEEEQKRLDEAWAKLDEERRQLGERSKAAKRQSLARARSSLSTEPAILAETVEELVQKATPRKKKLMSEKGITSDTAVKVIFNSITEKIQSLHRSRKKKDLKLKRSLAQALQISKKYRCQKKVCDVLKIAPRSLKPPTYRPHKRRVSSKTTETVHKFYADNSTTLPDKKFVSKKTKKATGFLTLTIRTLHAKFVKEHPNVRLGISKFSALRPSHIKPRHAIKYRGCLCEYCANIDLKLTTVNKIANSHHMPSPFANIYHLSDITMCDRNEEKYHQLPCIQRKCDECGVTRIKDHIMELQQKQEAKVTWRKWERESKVDDNGKKTSKMVLKTKEGMFEDLIAELEIESETISKHLFTAAWQSQEFNSISRSTPEGWLIMVLDFAENYSCRYQDEIQSVHWGHDSATIHPIVAYYSCPEPECTEQVTDSLIMITADNNHDHHAVHTFTSIAVEHLRDKLASKEIKKIVRFSDGCPSQYKSRGPFMDISYGKSDHGTSFQHEYFGSRHGKGPSDGESGVIKRMASDAVMSGSAVITNARDLYEFVKATATLPKEDDGSKCHHFCRTAFWVESVDRQRDRLATKTISGTRQLHSIVSVKPKVIGIRHLSCFCEGCREGGCCGNTAYVQPYVPTSMDHGAIVTEDTPTNQDPVGLPSRSVSTAPRLDLPTNPVPLPSTSSSVNLTVVQLRTLTNPVPLASTSSSGSLTTAPQFDYKVGEYVAVIYDDSWCAGEVTEVHDHMCNINFLSQKGDNRFIWPTQRDEAWVKKTGIFRRLLSPPTPVTSRYLGFDTKVVAAVSSAVSEYLKE